jgi:ABC-type dipeptide/oligopeptide/nickel transport system permease subunit
VSTMLGAAAGTFGFQSKICFVVVYDVFHDYAPSMLCVAMGQPLLAASTMLIYFLYISKSPQSCRSVRQWLKV